MFVGGTFYAFEIPNYFSWIDFKFTSDGRVRNILKRTAFAMMYFNPLWIARHMFFIKLFSGNVHSINIGILATASWSFLINIPISLAGNYVIQNKIKYDWRFFASAIFSSLMAIYYALSLVIF